MVEWRLQVPADGVELLALEEALPDVVFLQHGDVGPLQDVSRLHRQHEQPLQVGELEIDRGVRRAVLLPMRNVCAHVRRGDRGQTAASKPRREVVLEAPRQVDERPLLVDGVVGDQVLCGVLETHLSDL